MASNAVQATREGARFTVLTAVELIASEAIEVGASTPVVAPLCTTLLKVKGVVDGAKHNKEELEELCARCEMITVQVIQKAKASRSSAIDVSLLQQRVEELKVVAERCNKQKYFLRLTKSRKDGDEIQSLRTSIDAVVRDMGLASTVSIADQVEDLRPMVACLQPRPKLAPEPPGVPMGQAWHAVRDGVVDRVYEILGVDGGPAVAALTGRSGAGKTTAAAATVRKRQGPFHPRPGETEDQACTRLDRLRARFSDGVVWLRVGKASGDPDRLPRLMLELAKRVGKVIECVRAPEIGEAGESYVKKIVELKKKRCLVVADDVWEAKVVEKLRETGMWVLLTTRFSEIVEPCEQIVVDRLGETEAEDVLRGAANLSPDGRLCDDAMKVLEICDYTAMDIAFVGSWSSVRTPDNCAPKSSKAWARAVEEIKTQGGGVGVDKVANRSAVLHAGFKYLAREDPLAQELYAMLAVFPDNHFFQESEAAVLLDDEEAATGPISILERWGVVRADVSGKYRTHDAHVDFTRGKLRVQEDCRKSAVQRWMSHISRLDVAIGFDLYMLLNMWRALEDVGGEGWWASRPYDDQLVLMDVSHRSKPSAVNFVAELFEHDQKFSALGVLMQRVLEHCDDRGEGSRDVQMTAMYHTSRSLLWQGRSQEYDDTKHRLGIMVGPDFEPHLPDGGAGFAHANFHIYGVCARAAGRLKGAEEWFQKALRVEENGGRTASSQAVSTLHAMGRCVREAGRPGEAEAFLRRALEIREAKLGSDHVHVAYTLHQMSRCVRNAGRLGEAEDLAKRALKIKEAELGPDHVQVAYTLYELGTCVWNTRAAGGGRSSVEAIAGDPGGKKGGRPCGCCLHARQCGSMCAGGWAAGGGGRVFEASAGD